MTPLFCFTRVPSANPHPRSLPSVSYLYDHYCCSSKLPVLQFQFLLKSPFLLPLISLLFFTITLTHLDLVIFYFHSSACIPEGDPCVWLCECIPLDPYGLLLPLYPLTYLSTCLCLFKLSLSPSSIHSFSLPIFVFPLSLSAYPVSPVPPLSFSTILS